MIWWRRSWLSCCLKSRGLGPLKFFGFTSGLGDWTGLVSGLGEWTGLVSSLGELTGWTTGLGLTAGLVELISGLGLVSSFGLVSGLGLVSDFSGLGLVSGLGFGDISCLGFSSGPGLWGDLDTALSNQLLDSRLGEILTSLGVV